MVGENIRKYRIEKGMTQIELANAVHISTPMMCQIERGTKSVSFNLAKEIAKVLEISIEML